MSYLHSLAKSTNTRYLSIGLSLIVLIIVFFKPNPEARMAIRAADAMILGVASFFILVNLNSLRRFAPQHWFVLKWSGFILLGMFFTIGTQRLLGVKYSIRDLLEMYRPFLFFLLFSLGWYSAGRLRMKVILIFLSIFCAFEIAFGLMQLFNVGGVNHSPIGLIWSMHKVKPWQGRIVGTLANSNEYGYVLNMLMVILFYHVFRNSKGRYLQKGIVLLLHGLLIVFSSSRTGLVVWALFSGWHSYKMLKESGTTMRIVVASAFVFFVICVVVFWQQILKLLEAFWYVYQMIDTLMKNQNFWEIRQVKSRLVNYEILYNLIAANPFTGNGPQKDVIRIGDNDYLFTWAQWGLLGMVLKYTFFIKLALVLRKVQSPEVHPMAQAMAFSILALFIGALTVESFNNLKYIPMILLLSGYVLSKDYQALQSGYK